jgi:protein SCO1/2
MKVLAVAAVACLMAAGIPTAPPAAAQDHHHEAMEAAPPRGDSIYALSASLVDQRGQTVGLSLFRGHPVLISMFYANCPDACPLLIADLQGLERELPSRIKADLRIVLVSLDPERDTPDTLRALSRAHHLDESRWRLLRAPEDTVRDIAALLGIKYRRLPDGNFNHSSVITLLDSEGVIVARDATIGGPHEALLRRLRVVRSKPVVTPR